MKAGFAVAIALGLAALPANAQKFSDSYTFLKAVKERDGAKAEDLLKSPGSLVINTKDMSSGEAALHVVTKGRDRSWLAFLLSKGARADIEDRQGNTPLIIAAQLGWLEGADLLLRSRARVDQGNRRGETPLMFAVQNRDVPMIRFLLGRGANPKKTDNVTGYSAIDHAKRDARDAAILKMLEAPPAAAGRDVPGPKL